MKSFTITIRHDGDDEVHRVLVNWADGQIQAIGDALMEEVGDDFEFTVAVAQEGPGLVAETAVE